MSKKLNWEHTYSNPFDRARSKNSQYGSGKEMMQKAFEQEAEIRKSQEMLAKALPAMQALLRCRLESQTPLKVNRPFQYQTSEMITEYEKRYDDAEGWVDDREQPKGSIFRDVVKSMRPGTILTLKSLDPNLQEFVFKSQSGEEIILPYSASQNLMTATNIYEDVKSFMENKE